MKGAKYANQFYDSMTHHDLIRSGWSDSTELPCRGSRRRFTSRDLPGSVVVRRFRFGVRRGGRGRALPLGGLGGKESRSGPSPSSGAASEGPVQGAVALCWDKEERMSMELFGGYRKGKSFRDEEK